MANDGPKHESKPEGIAAVSSDAATDIRGPGAPVSLGPGSVLGGTYRLKERLGSGGMGAVYRAEHLRVGREVAVKLMRPDMSTDQDLVDRFCLEARAAGGLAHDGIVDILDINNEHGAYYIVMELLEGRDLHDIVSSNGPLPVDRSIEIARQLCEALGAAHDKGIIHRDIKPANIFVLEGEPDRVKLLDFGVSKLLDGASAITGTGMIIGTPLYMSPEQACGDPSIDQRADIYSVGAVLYQMLTGGTPFEAASPMAIIAQLMTEEPAAPSSRRPDIPKDLDDLVLRCIARNPENRFASARDLTAALRGIGDTGRTHPILLKKRAADRGPQEEDLRIVSVAFVSFWTESGSREAISPEVSSEILSSASSMAHDVIERHGGRVQRQFGDGLMAVFGAPVAHGDDAARALRALLETRDELTKRQIPVSMRAGVTTGRVVTGRLRGRSDSGWGVVGNAVGLARRIEGMGFGGTILACNETYLHVRGRFRVEPIVPSGAPGAVHGETIYSVAEENPHGLIVEPREVLGRRSPMAGRAAEMAQLITGLERSLDEREVQVVTVVGTPGLGKSRLANEFAAHIESLDEDVLLLAASGIQNKAGSPLALWADLIRGKAGIHADDSPQVASEKLEAFLDYLEKISGAKPDGCAREILGTLLGIGHVELKDEAFLNRLEDTLAGLLSGVAASCPVVLVMDDLQWSDVSSRTVLRRILDRIVGNQLFALLLARPEIDAMGESGFFSQGANRTRIDLKPLTSRETSRLITEILGEVPGEVIERVVERAAGTPLFVEEILHNMVERGLLQKSDGKWCLADDVDTLDIPLTVESVIQARLDSLPEDLRIVMQKAAVVGEIFWTGALEAMEESAIDGKLSSLVSREYLRSRPSSRFAGHNELAFRHATVRDVSYNTIPTRERQRLHKLVADWFSTSEGTTVEGLAQAAEHFEAAGEMVLAADKFMRAGGLAVGVTFGSTEETSFFTGERLAGSQLRVDPVTLKDSSTLFGRGIESALKIGRNGLAAQIAATAGEISMFLGELGEAARMLELTVEHGSPEEDPALFIRSLAQLGKSYANGGDVELAVRKLEEANSLGHLITDQTLLCHVERCFAQVCYVSGDVRSSISHSKIALEIASEAGLREAESANAHNIGDDYVELGEYDNARHYLEMSQRLAKELDYELLISINDIFLSALDDIEGVEGAHERLHETLQTARDHGTTWEIIQALYFLGLAHVERGEMEEARHFLEECVEKGRASANRVYEKRALVLLERTR